MHAPSSSYASPPRARSCERTAHHPRGLGPCAFQHARARPRLRPPSIHRSSSTKPPFGRHTDRACFALHRRALETYITSCSFRLVVRRLEGAPELQRRASLGFGQGMMLLLFCCGVLAFVLVETHAIACSLPGGGGADPGSTGRYLE